MRHERGNHTDGFEGDGGNTHLLHVNVGFLAVAQPLGEGACFLEMQKDAS
jgi:hypothetical protein